MIRPPTFPIEIEGWAELVELLPQPWPSPAAVIDLRWHTARGRIPTREDLADRWGWDTARTGELVADRPAWLDRSLPPPELPPGEIVAAQPRGPRRYAPSKDRPTHLHFDSRWREVLAVARSHPEYKDALREGWERQDLDHEIVERILAKQESEGSAYDPERAGMGKYLWTATRGVLLHLLEQRRTKKATHIRPGAFLSFSHEPDRNDTHQRNLGDAAEVAVADLWDPVSEIDEHRSQPAPVAPRKEGR